MQKKAINVLSLFDGISCGMVALERAGIKVNKYYASEIDKNAIQVSQDNYPDIIRLGDIKEWENWDIKWPEIDLIIGGSPCQGFSISGKHLNFSDPRSKLFFEYHQIVSYVKRVNPKVKFLLENVPMAEKHESVISSMLGAKPVMINSGLVSAQNRKRLYWANFDIRLPDDKQLTVMDIVHEYDVKCDINLNDYVVPFSKDFKVLDKATDSGKLAYYKNAKSMSFQVLGLNNKSYAIKAKCDARSACENYYFGSVRQIPDKSFKVGYFSYDGTANRVYAINAKGVTLMGNAGGGAAKMGQYYFPGANKANKIYIAETVSGNKVALDGYIRRLTPVECERLQTLPDNYTKSVPKSQRYKCLGNGWTVDVIAHIFRCMAGQC